MNRRRLLQSIPTVAVFAAVEGTTVLTNANKQATPAGNKTRPHSSAVTGIPLIDTKLAQSATELAKSVYPVYLFNHAMRTYIFGSLIGRTHGHRFDEETLYLACIFHDLGLTERFEGNLPFEIQGAEAARRFLSAHGVPQERAEVIWDGIALHASPIADFKRPEIALVGAGAGADVLGVDAAEVPQDKIAETLKVFPRLKFKESFLRTCADVVQRHPGGATRSFMRDVGKRFVSGFRPRNFCDLVTQAPFPE